MSRSLKKGPYVDPQLAAKVEKGRRPTTEPIKTWARDCTIIPDFVGRDVPGSQRQDVREGVRDRGHGRAQARRVLADADVQGPQRRQGESAAAAAAAAADREVRIQAAAMRMTTETQPALRMMTMEYRASHRYADMSARKIRPFADLIRGKNVDEALQLLRFCRTAARGWSKRCSRAPWERRGPGARDPDDLVVTESRVDDGPMFKRIMPRARGTAFMIMRRMCHIMWRSPSEAGRGDDGDHGRPGRRDARRPRPAAECRASAGAGRQRRPSEYRRKLAWRTATMGQKIRPTGFRTGIMIGWQSQWYANKNDFSDLLVEDHKIRTFILEAAASKKRPQISKIRIERTREKVIVTISSAKIGAIIGKKGEKIDKLTKLLQKLTRRHIEVKTIEVNRPETDAQIIAQDIAEQLEKRASFRRTMKQAMERAWRPAPRASSSNCPAGSAGRKWPAARRGWRGPFRSRRCGQSRIRVHRGVDRSGEHRDQGLGEQRRLPDRGHRRRAGPGAGPVASAPRPARDGGEQAADSEASSRLSRSKFQLTNLDLERGTWNFGGERPMPQMPKRVKFRKTQRGRVRGNATRGNTVAFGDFGLQSLEGGWLSAEVLEAGRVTVAQFVRAKGGFTSASSRTSP